MGGFLSTLILISLFVIHEPPCYLKVFPNSISVSNASNANATADWNIELMTKSPGKTCEFTLHTIKSRLFHGNKLISESSTTDDYYGRAVTGNINEQPLSYAVFKTVETPRNSVVWDLRVEVLSSIQIYNPNSGTNYCRHGFLTVRCDGFPVNFTADSTGDVKGSLVGYMRPCEYLFLQESSF